MVILLRGQPNRDRQRGQQADFNYPYPFCGGGQKKQTAESDIRVRDFICFSPM
jgi:hypothetical protein